MKKILVAGGLAVGILTLGGNQAFADVNDNLERQLKENGAIEVESKHGTEYIKSSSNTNSVELDKILNPKEDSNSVTIQAEGSYRIDHGQGSNGYAKVSNTFYGYADTNFFNVEWHDLSGNSVAYWDSSGYVNKIWQDHSIKINGTGVSIDSTGTISTVPSNTKVGWRGSTTTGNKSKYDLWNGVEASATFMLTSATYTSAGNVVIGSVDYRPYATATLHFS